MFFLIRPVGLQCQLTCGYCYYKDGHNSIRQMSAERMPLAIIEALLRGLPSLGGEHTFCVHGGEPLLIGKNWFVALADLVDQYNNKNAGASSVSLTVQTNAMLIDQEWVALFQKAGIGVSLSLDGPAEVHDSARTKGLRKGTHGDVLSAIDALSLAGIRIGCLAVVTARTLELGASRFYEYFRTIPLLNGLDVNPYVETGTSLIEMSAREKYEPDPDGLTRFLCDLFDLWLYDSNMVKRVDIRMFEQLIGVALEFSPSLCHLTQGASCGRTPSILPNGDVYACDLDLAGFDFRMGSLLSESIADVCSTARLNALHAKVVSGLERRGCTKCGLVAYCGLTCPRHTFSTRDHSPYCRMMETLVSHVKEQLNSVSRSLYAEEIEFGSEIQLSRPTEIGDPLVSIGHEQSTVPEAKAEPDA
jgi:uncharacterized protein